MALRRIKAEQVPPPPNAANQPLDSSARKLLNLMTRISRASGLRPFSWPRSGENNDPKRAKGGRLPAGWHIGAVRNLPRESPVTRRNPRIQTIKNPNRCRLGFACWWRWGELNPRPRTLRYKIYMLVPPTVLERGYPVGREHPNPASSFLVRRYPKHARFTIL